jgi:hypothetical protein
VFQRGFPILDQIIKSCWSETPMPEGDAAKFQPEICHDIIFLDLPHALYYFKCGLKMIKFIWF